MLKRLQVIRNIIEAQNFDELALEIEEFRQVAIEEEHIAILNFIDQHEYYQALILINRILKSAFSLKQKDEDNITGLKTLGKMLELEISVLANKRADLNKTINHFRLRHNQELGALISRILYVRKELLLRDFEENPERELQYEEAKKDWEEYHSTKNKVSGQLNILSIEEKKKIQIIFRKACKLCHPDVISDDFKEIAEEIFVELSEAYYHNNLERVIEIHEQLLNNSYNFTNKTSSVSIKNQLKSVIKKYEGNISLLKQEIFHIENSDSYQTIAEVKDFDAYFTTLKQRLTKELETLEMSYEEGE